MDILSNLELNKDVGIVFTGNPACSNEIISTIKKEENKGLNISNVDLLTVSQINGIYDAPQYNGEITIKPGNSEHAKLFLSRSEFIVTNGLNDPVIVAKEGMVSTGSISEFATYNINGQSLNIRTVNNNVLGNIDATCSGSHGSAFRISSKAHDLELKNEYDTSVISKIALMPAEIEAYTYCLRAYAATSINLRADNGDCIQGRFGEISLSSGDIECGTVISLHGGGSSGCKTNIEFSGVDDVIFCMTNVNVIDSNIIIDSGHIELNGCNTPRIIFNNTLPGESFIANTFEIVSFKNCLQSYIIHRNIFDDQQNCVGFIRFDFPNILPATCTIDVGFKLDQHDKGSRTEFVALKSDIPNVNHLEFENPTIPANCSLYEVSLAPTTFTKTPIMQLTNKSGAAQVADLCYNKTSNKVFVGIDHTAQIDAGEYKLSVFGM